MAETEKELVKEEIIKEKKMKWYHKVLIILFLILSIIFIYIRFIEPRSFVLKEAAIININLPDSFNGLKIIQFGDVYFGSSINENELDTIVNMINDWDADIVIYTGDLLSDYIQYSDDNISYLKEALKSINSTQKKYAVIGDMDYIDKNLYLEIMKEAGFTVLENTNDIFYYKDEIPIAFCGVSSVSQDEDDIEKATQVNSDVALKILIAHEPAIVDSIYDETIQIVFAGHSLGGQINIPLYGPLITKDYVNGFYKGHYTINNIDLYVTGGVGTDKYPIRFNNRPEINAYRLYNE